MTQIHHIWTIGVGLPLIEPYLTRLSQIKTA